MARKMREGECRTTRNGVEFCKIGGRVRFTGKGRGRRSRTLSGGRRGSGTKGKKCKRYQRVPAKGRRGTVRRCKSYG